MSDAVRHRAPLLRIVIAAVAAIDLLSLVEFVRTARASAAPEPLVGILTQTPVTGAIAALGVGAVISFARRPGRIASGATALVALAALSSVHARLFGSPWRHLYYSGLCLAGWIAGLFVARRHGAPANESYARTGALALLGAAYLNAGISKVAFGGADWATNVPIQSVIIGQNGLVPGGLLAAYRLLVVQTPYLAAAFSAVTVAFELAGPLMLIGWRTRCVVAGGLFTMHANILLLTGEILYWQAMLFLVVFAVVPDDDELNATSTGRPLGGTLFVPAVVVLAIASAIGISHQALRSRQRQHPTAEVSPPPVPAPPAAPPPREVTATAPPPTADLAAPPATPPPPVRQIGPFVVGAQLVDDWSIDALATGDHGFTVTLRGSAGSARFGVTCARFKHKTPFDVGAAHIFYFNDVSFDAIAGAGRAVRETVRRAAGKVEVCHAVAAWCAASGS